MNKWEAIVVGVDFSDSSQAAVHEAVRLANWHQCDIHLAHVVPREKHSESTPESAKAVSLVRLEAEKELKALCIEEVEFLREVHYHILVGHPFEELNRLTQDIHVDLLVLGACDKIDHPPHPGAIATMCIRYAPVPVLVIRSIHDNPYSNILVGVDFSETSYKAAEFAADIAVENISNLHLVHVHEPILPLARVPYSPPTGLDLSTTHRLSQEQVDEKLQLLKIGLSSRFKDINIFCHSIQHHDAFDALTSFIDKGSINLVVIGTHGRSDLNGEVMGTTAERIIQRCPNSILTVKPPNSQ